LAARDFKGVGNQYVNENKCVVEPFVKSSRAQTADDSETWVEGAVNPTLKSSQTPPSVAYPIQDGRNIEKHQNGLGVGDEHSPAYTIDQTGAQAVAYGIQGNMIGRQDHNGPAGKGHTEEGEPMFTLTGTDIHAVSQEQPTMAVRRLTPLECERLMGWPDDHTRWKADGTEQADTHRYKQCGNGVASPVAQWIGKHLLKLEEQQ